MNKPHVCTNKAHPVDELHHHGPRGGFEDLNYCPVGCPKPLYRRAA